MIEEKKPKWNNLMVDIETLDRVPGAIILSIAAVPFNWDGSYDDTINGAFLETISMESSVKKGFTFNPDTLKWWMKQSPEAIEEAFSGETSIDEALYNFKTYIQSLYPSQLQVWGNSNRFDLGILAAAFDKTSKSKDHALPWHYRNERDVRTLVSLFPQIKDNTKFEGVPHNPIDDCVHQIKYCVKIKNSLKKII